MRDLRCHVLLIFAGAALYLGGGLLNEAGGGFVPSDRLGAATLNMANVGIALAFAEMVLAAVGIFELTREHQ